jgi:hypothetical protein
MKKIIKKVGNSLCIFLTWEEVKVYNLKLGDVIEISEPKKVSEV